jgi:hypothetical protein
LTAEVTAEAMLVSGATGFGERLSVGIEVVGFGVVDAGGGVVVGFGMGLDPPALAHTFAAALLESHPVATMS